MTRLEQAKRWWRNNDNSPVPVRHIVALEKAGLIFLDRKVEEYWPTDKGKTVLDRAS